MKQSFHLQSRISKYTTSQTWTQQGRAAPTSSTHGSTTCASARRPCRCAHQSTAVSSPASLLKAAARLGFAIGSAPAVHGVVADSAGQTTCYGRAPRLGHGLVFPGVQDAYADRQREAPQTPALELMVVGPPMSSPTYTGTLGQVRKGKSFRYDRSRMHVATVRTRNIIAVISPGSRFSCCLPAAEP